MTEIEMIAFKKAFDEYPTQEGEGWLPDRGSFKAGFLAGRESLRAELLDERERSNRLLRILAEIENRASNLIASRCLDAMAEYEASRD